MPQKRNVPAPMKGILDIDAKLTSAVCNTVTRFLPVRSFTTYYKGLEVKCLNNLKNIFQLLIFMSMLNLSIHVMELYGSPVG